MAKSSKRNGGGYPQGVPRTPATEGEKKGINVKFLPEDYSLVQKAAANAEPPESMNLFIRTAALSRARAASPKTSTPAA
jgi:hypothetical protein